MSLARARYQKCAIDLFFDSSKRVICPLAPPFPGFNTRTPSSLLFMPSLLLFSLFSSFFISSHFIVRRGNMMSCYAVSVRAMSDDPNFRRSTHFIHGFLPCVVSPGGPFSRIHPSSCIFVFSELFERVICKTGFLFPQTSGGRGFYRLLGEYFMRRCFVV